jgi:hypothetical protein
MVKGRKQLRGLVRRMIGRAVRGGEAEMARYHRERRQQDSRIIAGKLHRVLHGRIARAAKCVVGAVDIGEEERVEAPALQRARDFRVIVEVAVPYGRAVQRMLPLALGLRTNRALGEGV